MKFNTENQKRATTSVWGYFHGVGDKITCDLQLYNKVLTRGKRQSCFKKEIIIIEV